ncbi:MAG: hypothetical protein DWI02_03815 [Planctomycetota bacterium]|nr:MAG: hypothetical protein DWI02_03815 [Planctomycetota bacterium]
MGLEQSMVITVGEVVSVSVSGCLPLKTSRHLFPTAARSHPAARSHLCGSANQKHVAENLLRVVRSR